MTSLVAVGCAAAAAALLVPPKAPGSGPRTRQRPALSVRRLPVLFLVAVVVVLLAISSGTVLALGLILVAVVAAGLRLSASVRHRREAARREAKVLEVCELLTGELRAGQPPLTAIERCVEVWPELAPVSTAGQLGSDVPAALRRLGETPGASGLRAIAGAWSVSQGAGAGLAVALSHVAASTRAAQATRRLVVAELASATATARMVAALPLVTLVMGAGIGADPWGFLLSTPAGLACLGTGAALAYAGLAWVERIAVTVARS